MNDRQDIDIEIQHIQQQMQVYLQKHWRIFLAEGVLFIALGIYAVVIPQFFTVTIVILLGSIILFGGVVHIVRALVFSNMPGFGLWLFMGILQIFIGYMLINNPVAGILTITMLMTLFFAFEGLAKIALAFMMRPLPKWRFILFSGITALVFALVVWISWPETAHWLLGVFLGINMVFLGWSLVKISLHYKYGD